MKETWFKGPPPHVGWWVASRFQDHRQWRWWNGASWSENVRDDATANEAAEKALVLALFRDEVAWTHYWPENARVPRAVPT